MTVSENFQLIEEAKRKKEREAIELAQASKTKAIERAEELLVALRRDANFFADKGISIDPDLPKIFLNHENFVIGCDCKNEFSIMLGRRYTEGAMPAFDATNRKLIDSVSEAEKAIAEFIDEGFTPVDPYSIFRVVSKS